MSPSGETRSRRGFILVLASIGALVLLALNSAYAVFRFFLPSIRFPSPDERPASFAVGNPADFPPDSVTYVPFGRLFVLNTRGGFGAMTSICTHLGCNVVQASGGGGFECPCHGSTFDGMGNPISGPAPAPLKWFKLRVSRRGDLIVDTRIEVEPEWRLRA